MGQLTSGQKYLADGTAIQGLSFSYEFDDIGNRKSTTINNQTANHSTNRLNQYNQRDTPGFVDVIGLSSATEVKVDDVVTVRNEEYYSSQVALANSVTIPYVIEVKEDSVVTETKSGYLRANPEFFTYDDDGNLLTDGLWNYFWNGENRLIRMSSQVDNTELEFSYDYMGRRFRKRVLNTGVLQYERRYLYDGYNCIAELDEHNTLLKTYLWGLDLSGSEQGAGGVGGLLAVTDKLADKTYYTLSDGNGNVTGYIDSDDGSLVYSVEYSPFGKVLIENGEAISDYGFSTKPLDGETGLNYYNYRYYSSETGRWISRDPIEERGGINLYVFAQNDGINAIDYLGLSSGDDDHTDVGNILKLSVASKPSGLIVLGYLGRGSGTADDTGLKEALNIVKAGFNNKADIFLMKNSTDIPGYLRERIAFHSNGNEKACHITVVVVGHSWGGHKAIQMLDWMDSNIPSKNKDLNLITIDSILINRADYWNWESVTSGPAYKFKGNELFINYWQDGTIGTAVGLGKTAPVAGAELPDAINIEIKGSSHTTIDDNIAESVGVGINHILLSSKANNL